MNPTIEAPETLEDPAVPPTPPDDFWGEGTKEPRPGPAPKRKAVIAFVGAVVLAGGSFFGIRALSSNDSIVNATAGTASANGTQGPGGGAFSGPGGGVSGTITKISGSTITLTTQSGTSTVTTSSSTTVTSSSTITASDIALGDNVTVMGTGTTTEIAAQQLVDSGSTAATNAGGSPGAGGAPPDANGTTDSRVSVSGTVTSVSGSTITVAASDGTTATVTLSSSTNLRATASSSVSALAVGDTVRVMGTTSGNTTTANVINVGDLPAGPGGAAGAAAPPNASVSASA